MRNILLGILILFSSCDLDIPFEDEISGKDAIDNVKVAREALNAAYFSYPKEYINFSILADDMRPTYLVNRYVSLKKLYMWDGHQINLLSEHLWDGYYHTVAQINTVLTSKDKIKFIDEEDEKEWKKIEGQANALKAMAYYELLNIYSNRYGDNLQSPGIILKDKIDLEILKRSSIEECVFEIDSLLKESKVLLKDKDRSVNYFDYYSVCLLHSRLMLFKGDYKNAIEYGKEIIDNIGYSDDIPDLNEYSALWKDGTCQEKLMAFDYTGIFLLEEIIDSKDNGDSFVVDPDISFTDQDVRKNISIIPFEMKKNGVVGYVTRDLLGKYRTSILDKSPKDINVLRLAEAYFIAAESYARKKEYTNSIGIINLLLKKRGSELLPNDLTGETLLNRILQEKRKEFVGEGLRYFDLKRLGQSVSRFNPDSDETGSSISVDDYRWLFPIPKQELRQNKNAEPNPGWQNIVEN